MALTQNKVKTPFQTLFAVPMTCDHCVKSVSDSLYSLEGITKVDVSLKDQLVTVEGTVSPSAIVRAIEATGRDAILRGSGASNNSGVKDRKVRGLARMVQASPEATLVDLTVRGVTPVWAGGSGTPQPRGVLGTVEVGKDGHGAAFLDHPFQVWEVIGHAMVVSRQEEGHGALKNDEDTIVGVIARSAGVWDNDKTVCSCTGKTLWEEREDQVKKGMI
ncbi:hypothetical protein DL771_009804 [Monosporascus sp. 5C6A]|nr:hypothetical protein DL771_009804 [Monosporascus sp. 5C6A]